MLVGPIFTREAVTTPRKVRFFLLRALYPTILFVVTCTAWSVLTGTQVIRNTGDMARFGAILFQVLAPLQLAIFVFSSAFVAAGAVAQEKDRRTLHLLLMTRLSNGELVLGKLLASMLTLYSMLAAAIPVFMLMTLFGGIEPKQIVHIFAVTAVSMLAAGALGVTIAYWREKTFQTLTISALTLLFWEGTWQAVHAGLLGTHWGKMECSALATSFSPLQAVFAAARPSFDPSHSWWRGDLIAFIASMLGITGAILSLAAWRVRRWNPSRQVRRQQITFADPSEKKSSPAPATKKQLPSRKVWNHPILWREMQTRPYGKKMRVIIGAYWVLTALVAVGLSHAVDADLARQGQDSVGTLLPESVKPLAPFCLLSLVIVNALAVTSITTERDGLTLDLLMATDISPREFFLGKLGGVFWVTKWMVVLPMLLCGYLWIRGGMNGENLVFTLVGLAVIDFFAATLGVHCGTIYSNSRQAISVSLGSLFFLFVGVVTCLMMMISFSGSFQVQLFPFIAFIVGGGIGLYVSIGMRNPSGAITAASFVVPFATFFAITSFIVQKPFTVFFVASVAYGFTAAAMLIPAMHQFDFAMGRGSKGSRA